MSDINDLADLECLDELPDVSLRLVSLDDGTWTPAVVVKGGGAYTMVIDTGTLRGYANVFTALADVVEESAPKILGLTETGQDLFDAGSRILFDVMASQGEKHGIGDPVRVPDSPAELFSEDPAGDDAR